MIFRQNPYATLKELETEKTPLLSEDMIHPDLRGDDFFHESSISAEMLIPTKAELTDTSSLVPESEIDVVLLLPPAQDTLDGLLCDKGCVELSPPSARWTIDTVVMRGEIADQNLAEIVARNEKYFAEAVMAKMN